MAVPDVSSGWLARNNSILISEIYFRPLDMRTWHSTNGHETSARLVRISGKDVVLESGSGTLKSIPLAVFSKEDVEYAKNVVAAGGPGPRR